MDSVDAPEATQAFELVLLGPPTLRDALGRTPAGLGSGKPLALLSFLVVHGEARRDEALALLWGDVDEERARNAFRQSLHRLRLGLGDDLVISDRQSLRIAVSDRLRTDVLDFDRAVEELRLDDAVALYRGDFLEGLDVGSSAFDQWADGERARLRDRCRSAAERAAQQALLAGRLDEAESAVRKLLAVAPLDAHAIELAATSFTSMGRRPEAAEVLQEFGRRSSRELGAALPGHLSAMLARVQPAQAPAGVRERPAETTFVGRDAEVAKLLAIWRGLSEASGGAVVIEGPAGSGKSRLVREVADSIRALGNAHVLHSVQPPRGHSAPYAGIASALRPLVRAPGIGGASPHLLAEAARLLPELRDSFQLPQIESAQDDAARLRIAEGVTALIEAAAFEQPVCLLLEDVDRASEPTLEMIAYLSDRTRRSPVFLVLTANLTDAPPEVASRISAIDAPRISLEPIARSKVKRSSQARAVLVRQFPHWRVLTIAAVATSLIALGVTALAPTTEGSTFKTNDTLVVARALEARRGLVHLVTGQAGIGLQVSDARERVASRPAWIDSLALPWTNPLPSPTGRFVAVERITPQGSNLYLIAANRRDTTAFAVGAVEAIGMGWAPDGESFLATRRSTETPNESGAGLYVFSTSGSLAPIAIDSSPGHSVIEASWSPDGSSIAWIARVGDNEEVFVASVDGSNRRNLSEHPAQDYHPAWSPDGSLLAFTSRRDRNAEIYAYDLINERLWRLTNNAAQDDRASFAGDGRFVAFESTRGGAPDVYVMPSLGGDIQRVGDTTSRYEIVGWRRYRARFIDRVVVRAPASAQSGDTVRFRASALDQFGEPFVLDRSRWSTVDEGFLRELPVMSVDSAVERRFVVLRDGLARVTVSAGAWRSDTAYLVIGRDPISLLRDAFAGSVLGSWWRALGQPRPTLGATPSGVSGLLLNADREWESGVLSNSTVPLLAGLSLDATLHAPFGVHAPATTAVLALVEPDPPEVVNQQAPQPFRVISITWNADARRLIYAAERDVFAEAVPAGAIDGLRSLGIRVNVDGTVSFLVDEAERWRSTLRVLGRDGSARAQLWLGGRDTGTRVAFGRVSVSLQIARP